MAISPQHATLVADTVTTLTFNEDFPEVEVGIIAGAAVTYFRFDGIAPVIGAAGTYVLPAAVGSIRVRPRTSGATVVKLISAATPVVTVRGIPAS